MNTLEETFDQYDWRSISNLNAVEMEHAVYCRICAEGLLTDKPDVEVHQIWEHDDYPEFQCEGCFQMIAE